MVIPGSGMVRRVKRQVNQDSKTQDMLILIIVILLIEQTAASSACGKQQAASGKQQAVFSKRQAARVAGLIAIEKDSDSKDMNDPCESFKTA